MSRVISIDLGATSGRVMVVSYENEDFKLDEVLRFSNYLKERNNLYYWDIEYIYKNIKDGIKKALNLYNDISSIGIDSWGCDFVYLKGNIASCYRDSSNILFANKTLKKFGYENIYKITGIQYLPFNTIFQLYKNNIKGLNKSKNLLIPDYFNYLLTGFAYSEETNLSTTAIYDYKSKAISEKLLELYNIKEDPFFNVIEPGTKIGNLILDDTLYKNIDVYAVCSHDTASAVLACPLLDNGAYLVCGTWSLLGVELNKQIINEESYKLNFTNEIGYDRTIRFLKNIMGQFIVEEVKNDFQKIYKRPISYEELYVETNDIINENYIDVDYKDFQLPGNMKEKIDNYLKLTKQKPITKFGEYIRMIYESMAIKYKYTLDKLSSLVGYKISSLTLIGGANKSKIFNQIVSNFCGINVYIGESEATVIGNAIAQFISQGVIKNKDGARKILTRKIEKVYLPTNELKIKEILNKYEIVTRRIEQ